MKVLVVVTLATLATWVVGSRPSAQHRNILEGYTQFLTVCRGVDFAMEQRRISIENARNRPTIPRWTENLYSECSAGPMKVRIGNRVPEIPSGEAWTYVYDPQGTETCKILSYSEEDRAEQVVSIPCRAVIQRTEYYFAEVDIPGRGRFSVIAETYPLHMETQYALAKKTQRKP